MRWLLCALAAAAMSGCKPPDESRLKVIIGATLLDGSGGPPISRSVVIVAGSRIKAIGSQAATPVPAGSDKYNGSGKFLIPIPMSAPPTQLPRVRTLEEARARVDEGARALTGTILDADPDPALLRRLRNLQVVFFPRLSAIPPGEDLDRARRNTGRLAAQGVKIGVFSESAPQEWELLAAAGLSPMEVLLAATRNAALALGDDRAGLIAAGRPADLWLLAANPLEDVRNLSRVERVMKSGEWVPR